MNGKKCFFKTLSIIIVIAFTWTNCGWAEGMESYKLAAQTQAAVVGSALGTWAENFGEALRGAAIMDAAEIENLGEIIENMKLLEEEGVKCLISKDGKKVAKYTFSDGMILRRAKTGDKEVNDKFYLALQKISPEAVRRSKIEIGDSERRELIPITNENVRFVTSILSKFNPTWRVRAIEEKMTIEDFFAWKRGENIVNSASWSTTDVNSLIKITEYSADGMLLAVADTDSVLKIYNSQTGEILAEETNQFKDVTSLYFVNDDGFLLTVDYYGTTKLYEIKNEEGKYKTGEELRRALEHPCIDWNYDKDNLLSPSPRYALNALSNDGRFLAISAFWGNKVTLCELKKPNGSCKTRAELEESLRNPYRKFDISDMSAGITCLSFNNNNRLLVADNVGEITMYNPENLTSENFLFSRREEADWNDYALKIVFSDDDELAVVIIMNGTVIIAKKSANGEYLPVKKVRHCDDSVARFTSGSRFLVLSLGDHSYKLYSIKNPDGSYKSESDLLEAFRNPFAVLNSADLGRRYAVAFSKDGLCSAFASGVKLYAYHAPNIFSSLAFVSKEPVNINDTQPQPGERDEQLVRILIEKLKDEDSDVVKAAEQALKSFGYIFDIDPDKLTGARLASISFFETVKEGEGYVDRKIGERVTCVGKPKSSQYSQTPEGKQAEVMRMAVDFAGKIDKVEVKGDLTKLAGILGVETDAAQAEVVKRLQNELGKLNKGIFGAVKEIILVDNLGGLESARGPVALLQNGVVLIDIDAFRNDVVLRDVIKHELWESILELVEQNPGVREATAIYENLLDFAEMQAPEQITLITFLKQRDNGLESQNYGDLLQYVKNHSIQGEKLIPVAISFVLSEPRYSDLRESLKEGMDDQVREAIEKLGIATIIYNEIERAITDGKPIPAVGKVKTAEFKAKALMKVRMVVSNLLLSQTELVSDLTNLEKPSYIRLDAAELKDKPHIIDWLKTLLEKESFSAERKSPFILFSSSDKYTVEQFLKESGLDRNKISMESDIKADKSGIITLLDLGKVNQDRLPQNTLVLPLFYSVSNIYLAYQIVKAGGDLKELKQNDNLAYTSLMSLYKAIFGDEFTEEMLGKIIFGQLPPIVAITETLNTLREAIAKIEIAA